MRWSHRPASAGRLVGRERDLDELVRIASADRLVTVLGPPGVGKTRLVVELATRADLPFQSGVFVDVGEARTADELTFRVASALEVPAADASDKLDRVLFDVMRSLPGLLVVFDHADGLVDDASLLSAWQEALPDATILVTSRRRLRARGEVVFDLEPLGLPVQPGGDDPPSPSEELFLHLARAARRDFAAFADDRAAIAEIVRELDGLPLAIELCAARVRVLSPSGLLARFSSTRTRTGGRAAATLHGALSGRSLEGLVTESLATLADAERAMLEVCSVFRGGFSADAVEAVYGECEGGFPVDLLESLIDRSLVRPREGAGGRRFELLRVVRSMVEAAGDAKRVEYEHRHARHFARRGLSLARRVLRGDVAARNELAAETDDLRVAHERAVSANEPRLALSCAIALVPVLTSRGPLPVVARALEAALALPGVDALPRPLLADGHGASAVCGLIAGDLTRATERAASARAFAEGCGDPVVTSRIFRHIGRVALARCAWEEGASLLEKSRALSKEAGDRHGEAHALLGLGELSYHVDDLARAADRFAEARDSFERSGDPLGTALSRFHLGTIAVEHHDVRAAREHLVFAVAELTAQGDLRTVLSAKIFLAILDQAEGNLPAARTGLETARVEAQRLGLRRVESNALGYLAGCLLELGDTAGARATYHEAARLVDAIGSAMGCYFEGGLAVALATADDVDGAERALANARASLERATDQPFAATTLDLHEQHLVLARARRTGAQGEVARAITAARRELARERDRTIQSDVRFAVRLLERALRIEEPPAESMRVLSSAPAPALILRVGPRGRWFSLGERTADLSRRGALSKILDGLSRQRAETPGRAIDLAGVIGLGWPGESIQPNAAAERAYNAIATLRRMGLESVLLRRDDGYLLDPACRLDVEPEGDLRERG